MASEIIRDIGKAIAAEIRVMGHYQGIPTTNEGCCVITSPTYWNVLSRQRKREFVDALAARLGFVGDHTGNLTQVMQWNDRTGNREVMAVLESM